MQEISLDGLLFTSPDGFHVLTDEERSGMHTPWKGPWTGIRDPERHILVTAGVRQAGWLASLLLSARDLADRTEKQISRAMAPYGYRAGDRVERMIAGERAFGFRYAYDADGIAMCAESCVLKQRGKIYDLHLYAREAAKDESLAVWETILSSARLSPPR
ncbi:MAG: hypothetical protein J6Q17_05745 [Clostridia bacterium]|nr:hypothetical protein [Clostridia bacterium]